MYFVTCIFIPTLILFQFSSCKKHARNTVNSKDRFRIKIFAASLAQNTRGTALLDFQRLITAQYTDPTRNIYIISVKLLYVFMFEINAKRKIVKLSWIAKKHVVT